MFPGSVAALLLGILQAAAFPVSRFEVSSDKLIDLSYPFNNRTVYWINSVPLQFTLKNSRIGRTPFGYYYRTNSYEAAEHGGTHLDAPSHFAENGVSAAQIAPENLIGPAVVIDVKEQAAANPDYLVTVEDISAWESSNGKIPEGAFVFMNSGWSRHWPDKPAVFGSQILNASSIHFPGFSPDATTFLIEHRKIKGLGSDTPGTDNGQTRSFGTHVALASAGLVGLENVANLDKMPAKGGHVILAPMKIDGGSGSPCRIFGVIAN